MLSDRRGDQLKATRKQAAETERQAADRPGTTQQQQTDRRARSEAEGAGRTRPPTRGRPRTEERREGREGRRRKGERKKRRRPGRKGGTRPGRREAKQAKKDNRQPQEHERERQEDKLVPTTTQESNSLRAKGRDGRVVVWRRRRTAATANVVAPADFPTERAQHPDTKSDRSA